MIYYFTPYSTEKKLGKAYNNYMQLIPNEGDWACFMDYDAMFTVPNFGHQLESVLKRYPKCGLFTAVANRIGTNYQQVPNMWNVTDEREHREKGLELQKKYYHICKDITTISPISGMLILIQKKIWSMAGKFSEELDILGVDNDIHRKVQALGLSVMVMQGVYLYHWYRGGNPEKKEHLL